MTPSQYRMARAALRWTTRQVAAAAGLPVVTVTTFEAGTATPAGPTAAIRSAMEDVGIVFLVDDGHGAGVRFKAAETTKTGTHVKPAGPATDVIERMEAEIAADRGKVRKD